MGEGTYYENITIDKNLYLIGEETSSVIIDAQGNGSCISINQQVNGGEIKNFTLKNNGNDGISINGASGIYISNNHFFSAPMQVENAHDNVISNNIFDQYGIGIHKSWANTFENNTFDLKKGFQFRVSNSDYNSFINNEITSKTCRACYFYHSDDNLFTGNSVDGCRRNIILVYCNGWIIANNSVVTGWVDIENELWSSGILLFHSQANQILNNSLTVDTDDEGMEAGITLYNESSNNLIQGNSVSYHQRGIELYYDSNQNEVINNQIFNNQIGMRLEKTTGNVIYRNNFVNNNEQAYSSGENSWSLCTDSA